MYSKFYGLSHNPFELSPNPDLIFLSETHQEALSVLFYGVYNRKGFLQISGNVGTGKSTLVQALIRKLGNNVLICHIPNPNFTVSEFYYYISAKFGLDEFDGNKAKFILNLAEFLKNCREKDKFALLIIDEAQVLSLELLEEIRLLSNQEYTEFGVLSIFFVGQPELNVLLKHKKMEPLRNRIGIRFNLEPLTLDETDAYIQFRLRKAGRTLLLFSQKAVQKIYEASGGIPRSINILCDNALVAGYAEQRGVIDEKIISGCVKELEQPDISSGPLGSDKLNIRMQPESTSPKPVQKEDKKTPQKTKSNALGIKLAVVFVIFGALFFVMIASTGYWGRLPGTKSAKAWVEKFHVDVRIFKKLQEYFIAPKSEAQLSLSEKNMTPKKVIALSGHQEKKNNDQKESVVETKLIAEPVKESLPPYNMLTEAVETKQNPDEINYANAASQVEPEPTVTSLAEIDTTAEQIEIRRNPDGTNYISITGEIKSGSIKKGPPEDVAISEPPKTTQKSDEINYGSITSQVGGANIRSGPSMDYNILRAVVPGYPFRVIDRYGDWSLVEDYKKRKGWVASWLIIKNMTVVLMFDKAYLQSGPSYDNNIVSKLDYGTIMQVEKKQGHWLKVNKRDGVFGWIHGDMVWP